MKIKRITVGPLDANCYVVWDDERKEAAIVDPGGSADKIAAALKSEGLTAKYLINTHGHFDHVGGNGDAKQMIGAPLGVHPADAHLLADTAGQAAIYGISVTESPKPDLLLEDGTVLEVGSLQLEIIHTPGHTEGGVCVYIKDEGVLFTGDTLFAGSIGRTDLPGGSYDELMRSIKERILSLPPETRVLPGHEGESTIAREMEQNPYLKELL